MEIVLIVLAFLFLLAGLFGSIIPVLPGPPLSYIGLLLLQWSGYGSFSPVFLWVWAAITAAVTVMDYILPALVTKKFGGSRAAVFGSVLGLIVGIFFFPPLGLLIGPFLGALAGELINNRIKAKRDKINGTESDSNTNALIVALGTFLAFMLGTGAKLIIGSFMIYYAIKAIVS